MFVELTRTDWKDDPPHSQLGMRERVAILIELEIWGKARHLKSDWGKFRGVKFPQ